MKLDWNVVSDTDNHTIWRATTSYGEWTVSTVKPSSHFAGELFREVKVSFRPAYPEGETPSSISAKINALRGGNKDVWTEEMDVLHRYSSATEVATLQGWFESLLLVEMLHEGDAGLNPAAEMLLAGGFEFQHEFENWRGPFAVYRHKELNSLGVILSEDGWGRLQLRPPQRLV
jgi:hypothetical protein